MEHGGTSIRQMIARWPGVDAAVCVSDLSAFGAVMECHRQGWDVPDRIAIAGFGDFEVARCAHPRITSVSVDAIGIGRAAGRLMLEAIEASRRRVLLAPQTKILPFRVIERQSTLGASRKD